MLTPLVVLLAQMCVAEIGWARGPQHLDECQVMWTINNERAERWAAQERPWPAADSLWDVTWLYNSAFKCEGRTCDTPRMQWVRNLNADATEPVGWPRGVLWAAPQHRGVWLRTLKRARWWLDNGRPWPKRVGKDCQRTAVHYGGNMDKPRACWREVLCTVGARQRYWRSDC